MKPCFCAVTVSSRSLVAKRNKSTALGKEKGAAKEKFQECSVEKVLIRFVAFCNRAG